MTTTNLNRPYVFRASNSAFVYTNIYLYILFVNSPGRNFSIFFCGLTSTAASGLSSAFAVGPRAACRPASMRPGPRPERPGPHGQRLPRRAAYRAGSVPAALPLWPHGADRERPPFRKPRARRRAALARALTYKLLFPENVRRACYVV